MVTLNDIVNNRDLESLESLAIRLPYHVLIAKANREGVDTDELEELLAEIS